MGNNLDALTTLFTEFYYWVTVVFMFLIHVGFCLYEVAASRRRNHLHTLMKNTMLIPLVTITFFFFGWWIYWAVPAGPVSPSMTRNVPPPSAAIAFITTGSKLLPRAMAWPVPGACLYRARKRGAKATGSASPVVTMPSPR